MPSDQPVVQPGRWQPLPGAPGSRLFPLESRPNLLTSNSHVLCGRDVILVIDPGADARQIRKLSEAVAECLRDRPLPVLVLLTHCHRDHVREVRNLQIDSDPVVIAHDAAARALAAGDRALTMAEIFAEDAPRCDVQVALFPPDAKPRTVPLPAGRTLTITPVAPGPDTGGLPAERLQVGVDSFLVLHTPGHSPDGISLRAGGVLFSGDLSVAARPLVAGIAGWDQPALMNSLTGVLALLRSGVVSVLAPGHAFSMSAPDAAAMLDRTLAAAATLGDLERFDAARVRQLADYTRTLVGEIGDSLAVIAGRLDTAAFHLDAMDEKAAAADALRALDVETVDGVLDSFREHLGAVLDGRSLALSLPHKGMATILRLDAALTEPALADYVSPLLLRRTRRMIADFIHMMYGIRQAAPVRPVALAAAVKSACDLAHTGGRQEGDLDAVIGDSAAFAKAMGRRIVQQPVAEQVAFDITAADALPPVFIEQDRFVDLLAGLIELLAAQGAKRVLFNAAPQGSAVRLCISTDPASAAVELESRRLRFFDIVLRAQGGACRREGDALIFDLPSRSDGSRA